MRATGSSRGAAVELDEPGKGKKPEKGRGKM